MTCILEQDDSWATDTDNNIKQLHWVQVNMSVN